MSYQRWYRTGTAAFTNGSTAVVGTTTAWLADIRPGDGISLDGTRWAEIDSITDNTHLVLTQPWGGATASGSYMIDRRSVIRQIVSDLGARYTAFIEKMKTLPDISSGNASSVVAVNAASNAYELRQPWQSGRNRLINGDFAINQRGVSGTITLAAGAYGVDRWKAGAGGCTFTIAATGTDVVATITAGSLCQVIEATAIQGGTYTLNHTGTAQARVHQGSPPTYASVGSGLVVTLGAGANTTVEFSTGTVSLAQLEPGNAPTPFDRRDLELQRCRRFFMRWVPPGSALIADRYHNTASANDAVLIPLGVAMRAAPTATVNGALTVSNCSFNSIIATSDAALMYFLIAAAGRWYVITPAGFSIDFSAEL